MDVTYHNVITEWRATNPAANAFAGTRRELLRTAHIVANLTHPLGAVEFNPTAKPGERRLRSALHQRQRSWLQQRRRAELEQSRPDAASRLDHYRHAAHRSAQSCGDAAGEKDWATTRFRCRTSLPRLGPPVLGEIYAHGFRNAHRLSWDTDGTMFANDIGMNHIEEINIIRNGGNYGWMAREGYWENGRWRGGKMGELGALSELYPLSDDILEGRAKDGITYPVAIYDHDEGVAITSGFAYHGRIAALRGKYVFGDINGGRIFAADLAALKKADDGIPPHCGADRGSAALRAGRWRQSGECIDAGTRR